MKKTLVLTCIILTHVSAIELKAQSCGTPHPAYPTVYSSNANARGASSAHCIDVFYHIVRNTNGTNAFTPNNLDDITEDLNEFFSPHNIIINNAGSDFINNTNFLNIGNSSEAATLGQTNNHPDAINYYLVETLWNTDNGFVAGTANSIPSNNLVIRNDRTLTSTSPHEFGHCLNLLHTHETAYGTEAINGSNCLNAGDLICDTPADPRLFAGDNVDFSCTYTGGGGFNPSTENIMSYSFGFCRDQFTNEQGIRMRTAISEETLFEDLTSLACVSISEVNTNVCFSSLTTITLSNLAGATTTWTSSPSVQIISSNNSSATFRAATASTLGEGWIRANLDNMIQLTEEFWVGKPSYSNSQIQGTSSQVGLYSSAQLSVSQVTGGTSYQWSIVDDYNSCNGSYNGPVFWEYNNSTQVTTPSNNIGINFGYCQGTFRIRCSANNSCGSSSYNDFVVTVGSSGPCNSTLTLSPNPTENGAITFKKAPAPCNDLNRASASSTEPTGMSFTVFDMSGEPVLTGESKTDVYQLNINQLKPGRYIIHVLTPEKQILKSTFITK
jgi:hypothetical protein